MFSSRAGLLMRWLGGNKCCIVWSGSRRIRLSSSMGSSFLFRRLRRRRSLRLRGLALWHGCHVYACKVVVIKSKDNGHLREIVSRRLAMDKLLLFERRRLRQLSCCRILAFFLLEDGDDIVVYFNVRESVVVFVVVVHGGSLTIAVVAVRTKDATFETGVFNALDAQLSNGLHSATSTKLSFVLCKTGLVLVIQNR